MQGRLYLSMTSDPAQRYELQESGGGKLELTIMKVAEVVEAIKKHGGKAVANTDSIINGGKIIEAAVGSFGGIHILINAAPVLSQATSFETLANEKWSVETERFIKGNFLVRDALI